MKNFAKWNAKKEKEFYNELDKVTEAENSYRISNTASSYAAMFFVMCIVTIVIAGILEFLIIDTNATMVLSIIVTLLALSLASVYIATASKYKTLSLLEQHYKVK